MTIKVRYRCNNCGHRFEAEILDEREKEEARRKNQPTYKIQCPTCKRTDVRQGWE